MIGPKKKISIRKGKIRHSAWQSKVMGKLAARIQISKCSNCGEAKHSHRVCNKCGRYGGKQVVTIKSSGGSVVEA